MSQSDFVSRGQALVAAGQFQEAVKVCRLGLLGRPTTVEGRVVLGQALLALKRFDEVLAEMRVALELDQTSVAAQILRAEALLRKGDTHPAIEALHKARQGAPGDPRILQLLGEAENGVARSSVSHPAVGFLGSGDTKNYPQHPSGSGNAGDEDTGGESFTKPTSLAAPGAARRSSQKHAVAGAEATEMTPPPAILDVGDKSGTVEVDPELEGVELGDDDDFDEVAAPPSSAQPAKIGGARGSVKSSVPAARQRKEKSTLAGKSSVGKAPVPTMSLDMDDGDVEELNETPQPPNAAPYRPSRPPGPGTAVRNAVAMPSGVIGDFSSPPMPDGRRKGATLPPPQRSQNPSAAPPLAVPSSLPLGAPPGVVPPAPLPPAPRSPIVAALPTVAAAQPPPPFVQQQAPYPPTPASLAAAQRPTMAVSVPMSAAQQASAAAVDQLFSADGPVPNWAQSTMAVNPNAVDPRSLAAAQEPTARPGELDPQILALMSGAGQAAPEQAPAAPMRAMENIQLPPAGMKTGVRKARSRLQVAMWILIGIVVIGGGVFAGFQIRAMRLDKQIVAARQHATDLAKADTFSGWGAARDSLAGIVQASSTLSNRAALARARALIAFEFGDGLPEAKAAVEELGGAGAMDGNIAAAFDALARGDIKAAKSASDAAVAGSDADPAAQYVAGHAALLAGNAKVAVAAMKLAADKEARPLHGVGLARAYAASYNWDESIAALDRVLAGNPDHPAAVIVRGTVLSASGRIFPGSALGNEVKQQLERIIAEGRKPAAEQKTGVSPTQLAFANLTLARVEQARGDTTAARKAVRAATDVNIEDARFAEETIETLYHLGDLQLATRAGEHALESYAASPRVRIAYAQALLAQGKANDAIDMITKLAETLALPDALAVRGSAYLANGDTINAAADFDAALKLVPTHEPALVGRAWLELQAGEVDAASKRMAERMSPKGSSLAVATAYAATLRRSADPAQRDQAKTLLERIVAGPASPDAVRAQLELARIYRDAGDFNAARPAYEKAGRNGSLEARLEHALILIEYSKPAAGRDLLEKLLVEAGDRPSGNVVIETARARMLVGAHADAAALLDKADKMSSVERWRLDRERGRLAFRKSDFPGAAAALTRALDGCGSDIETFLLAADTASAEKSGLADKVKQLAPGRLKGRPEAKIVEGKLLIASEKPAEAENAYRAAKAALKAERASHRRLAQADFGIAVIEYSKENIAAALNALELVTQEDPTIIDAYIYASEMTKEKNKKKAFEYAQKATEFNPDHLYAWLVVGQLAHEMKDKKALNDAIARLTIIAPQGDELKELTKLRTGG